VKKIHSLHASRENSNSNCAPSQRAPFHSFNDKSIVGDGHLGRGPGTGQHIAGKDGDVITLGLVEGEEVVAAARVGEGGDAKVGAREAEGAVAGGEDGEVVVGDEGGVFRVKGDVVAVDGVVGGLHVQIVGVPERGGGVEVGDRY
jgi:hypothetical protein